MTLPLAIVFYEDLMPGSQLVNRLQDLQYRVQVVADPAELTACARSAGPMLILADLVSTRGEAMQDAAATCDNRELVLLADARRNGRADRYGHVRADALRSGRTAD